MDITVNDVYNLLDRFAPFATQGDFDNACIISGKTQDIVKGILITVDVTHKVVEEAVKNGCNLIIAHHPILFVPQKSITDSVYATSVVLFAIENKINIIAAHTNLDLAKGGINDRLAKLLGGKNITQIDEDEYARVFEIKPCLLYDYAEFVAGQLQDNTIRIIGENTLINKICVVGGSGGSETLVKYCKKTDTVLMTADVRHSLAAMADDIDTKVIVFGHFTSEQIFVTIIKEILEQQYPLLKITTSKSNCNPYRLRNKE